MLTILKKSPVHVVTRKRTQRFGRCSMIASPYVWIVLVIKNHNVDLMITRLTCVKSETILHQRNGRCAAKVNILQTKVAMQCLTVSQ